jgi:hypothetical protein
MLTSCRRLGRLHLRDAGRQRDEVLRALDAGVRISVCVNAVIVTGTSSMRSSRWRAVTMISSS